MSNPLSNLGLTQAHTDTNNITNESSKATTFYFDILREGYYLVKVNQVDQLLRPIMEAILGFQIDPLDGDPQLLSLTVTHDEVSIVIREELLPKFQSLELEEQGELAVGGPFYPVIVSTDNPARDEPGILARITQLFAKHDLSIFCLSTYNGNYILFPQEQKEKLEQIMVRQPDGQMMMTIRE